MNYRKFRPDRIFTGNVLLDEGYVLVTSDEGKIQDILPAREAGDDVEVLQGILSPGFINCHCHLELSHMKGMIPENTGMSDFVLAVVQQRHLSEDRIYTAIDQAETEMLKNGIVAVGDICNNLYTIRQKHKGRLYYHNFIEASGFVPEIAAQRFRRSVDFFNGYAQLYSMPVESNSIVPHAAYSVSKELFGQITSFPGNHILTMHNQEAKAEEELFMKKEGDFIRMYSGMNIDISFFEPTGNSSLRAVIPFFKKNQKLILVHNVTTSQADIDYLKENGESAPSVFFCLCPNANLYIGNGLPDIETLANSGYPLVVGTDSLASNKQLSILEELKTLSHYKLLKTEQLLKWSTLNGAKALEIDALYGSFDSGKQPGVLLLKNVTEYAIAEDATVERLV
jgi:aminodeoxyfutalosine deaminase